MLIKGTGDKPVTWENAVPGAGTTGPRQSWLHCGIPALLTERHHSDRAHTCLNGDREVTLRKPLGRAQRRWHKGRTQQAAFGAIRPPPPTPPL